MKSHLAALALLAIAEGAAAEPSLPFEIGGPFELLDQNGVVRTEVNPDGHPQLLFFGYASCQAVCSAAMPMIAGLTMVLAEDGIPVTPVMITVAPEQDKVETMGEPLARFHPEFVGLTGSKKALQQAYDAFSVDREPLFEDPEHGLVYAHGSFIYLLDPAGAPLTLIPPILSVPAAREIVDQYLSAKPYSELN